MAMSKEQLLKGIERAEQALSRKELSEGAKASLQKQVAQMKVDLAALEVETTKKEEKIEQKEQAAIDDLDAEIARCEAMLNRNPPQKIKEVFQNKLKIARQKKADAQKEAKQDKEDAKQELKEVKEAVKDITEAVATGRTEPIKKPKIEEKKREKKAKSRIAGIQTAITNLQDLVKKNKDLKPLYEGKRVDLKRDAGRSAKPFGYRFIGKHDYRVPTDKQIKAGLKRGAIDYEARPNRSDKYAAGYKGNIREKLADGGSIDDLRDEVRDLLMDMSKKEYRSFCYDYEIDCEDAMEMEDFIKHLNKDEASKILGKYADGGKTKESHSDQMIDIMNRDREKEMKKAGKKKYKKYEFDASEDELTGEREGERKVSSGPHHGRLHHRVSRRGTPVRGTNDGRVFLAGSLRQASC